MENTFFSYKIAVSLLVFIGVFMMQTVPVAYATTVVNYLHVQSVSGGQKIVNGQDGADGQNGKNGADGQRGQDGADGQSVFSPEAIQMVSIKSTVDGVTVFESTETNRLKKEVTLLAATSTTPAVAENTVSIHLSAAAQTEATAITADSRYEHIQEVVSIIRLLLVTYVSKLF